MTTESNTSTGARALTGMLPSEYIQVAAVLVMLAVT
jgi:hypothetical protein